MAKLFANSGDPDQMVHSAASDLGLHCSPITLLGVSKLQWVKEPHKDDELNELCCERKVLGTFCGINLSVCMSGLLARLHI